MQPAGCPTSRLSTASASVGRRQWESDGTYRFDRSRDTRRNFLDRHAAADRQRVAAHGFGVRLRADRRARPLPAHARPRGLLPDGLGRQRARRPSAGCRTSTACAAIRTCRTTRRSSRRRSRPRTRSRSRGPTSSSCARGSSREDEQAFEELWRGLGLSVDWTLTYTTIGTSARRTSQRAFLRNLARGEAYQADAPTLWDVDMRTAVAQAELEDREMPGAYHALRFHRHDGAGDVVDRHDAARAARRVRRGGRASRRRALPAAVRHRGDRRRSTACRFPCVAHRLADPEKGTGIAMICTFGDITDVMWWRELQLPTRAIIGVDGRMQAEPPDGHRRRRRERVRGDRGQEREAGAEDRRRAAARVGRARRRAAADHAPGEVLRARRPPARDRHVAAVVLPQRRPRSRAARRAARARARAALASAAHARRATTRGSKGSTPTGS